MIRKVCVALILLHTQSVRFPKSSAEVVLSCVRLEAFEKFEEKCVFTALLHESLSY